MKILMANKYFFLKGGSEYAFFDTVDLLRKHGHQTMFFSMRHPSNLKSDYERYFVSEVDFDRMGAAQKLASTLRILYSLEARRKMLGLVKDEHPDVAHLNNIYHQLSPSIIHSLKKNHIPVVMTLHDFKMICPAYALTCKGRVCEKCKGQRFYNCFLNSCVKDSRAKSLVTSFEMYLHHRIMHIYDLVDVFIAPSRFLQKKLKEMGFKGTVVYLPNFIDLKAFKPQFGGEQDSIVYFGRLAQGKGLESLLDAVNRLPEVKLSIIGDGPEKFRLMAKAVNLNMANVEFKGYIAGKDLWREIQKARFVVMPAENVENNPRSVIEAFALGKPVVATQAGGIAELVKHGQTGLVYRAGDSLDLAEKISTLIKDHRLIKAMGRNARALVEAQFSAENHYQQLIAIYAEAMQKNAAAYKHN